MAIKIAVLLTCLPFFTWAHNLTLQQPIPAVSVTHLGELTLHNNTITARNWQLSKGKGKVRLIQHIAGRTRAKELNAPLIDAIKAAKLPRNRYRTVTIINVDDALFGTSSFVRSSAKSSKREYPWSSIVLDENAVVAQTWQLAAKSSAIILLDQQDTVLFAKEGALTSEQIMEVMQLIQGALKN
ncbi:YtfJ family protein [Oceanisphaera pacifica]|uniref:YtfJ family protein n=1 Tax=Oceanisphaera pacifica TaxID=2818389 RepID=A0ABS3NF96_9GAMM|nr:YtfJ family protein [Oceanisphaera pacifica]MBO1519247.1 YtfJ family protein [Oceanisphaera pacifica]